MNGVSLGLNWYLNTNLTVMTEWVYNSRYDRARPTTDRRATRAASALGCSCPSNHWA